MRIQSLLLAALCASAVLSSCDKYSQIDSSNTITEPFVVHAGGLYGMVARTNNAQVYDYIFADDKNFSRGIFTYDNNIFHLRSKIYRADGSKPNYAPVVQGNFDNVNKVFAFNDNGYCLNTYAVDKKHGDVYVCSNSGLVISGNKGKDAFIVDPNLGAMTLSTSIAQLDNGDLFAYNCQGTPSFFKREQPVVITDPVQVWQTLAQPAELTTGNNELWMLGTQGNTLWAVEKNGYVVPHYTANGGGTWTATTGLPDSVKLLMAKSTKLNDVFFVACDSVGLFRFNETNNAFEYSSGNLPAFVRIYDITSKRNIYRSGSSKDYYFLATNMGLFMSDNDALDWNKVNEMPFSALW